MKRWVFVLGILWTSVWLAFIVFTGGEVRTILPTTDAQGVVHESPCANDPTCGEIAGQWWAPWALWLVGLLVITVVVWLGRRSDAQQVDG